MLSLYEWKLLRRWFQHLQHPWRKRSMEIDAFIPRTNNRISTYWSPLSEACWEQQRVYFNRIDRRKVCIESTVEIDPPKMIRQLWLIKVQGAVLIIPLSLAQHWWSMLHKLKWIVPSITLKIKKLKLDLLKITKCKWKEDGFIKDPWELLNKWIRNKDAVISCFSFMALVSLKILSKKK